MSEENKPNEPLENAEVLALTSEEDNKKALTSEEEPKEALTSDDVPKEALTSEEETKKALSCDEKEGPSCDDAEEIGPLKRTMSMCNEGISDKTDTSTSEEIQVSEPSAKEAKTE